MPKNEMKALVKSKPIQSRLFITYVNDLDPREHDELGVAKWFVFWFRVSAVAIFASEFLIWTDTILELIYGTRILLDAYAWGFHVTWESLDDVLGIFVLGALPVSVVLALPVLLRIRAERKNLLRLREVEVEGGKSEAKLEADVKAHETAPISSTYEAAAPPAAAPATPNETAPTPPPHEADEAPPPPTDFTLQRTKGERIFLQVIAVIGVVFFLQAALFSRVLFENFLPGVLFALMCVASIYFCVRLFNHAKKWRIQVSGSDFTIYTAFGEPRTFTVDDISTVTVFSNKNGAFLTAFQGRKKLFSARAQMLGGEEMYHYLHHAQKMDFLQAPQENFIVRKSYWLLGLGLLFLILSVSAMITGEWLREEAHWAAIFSPIIAPASFFYILHFLRWRVKVAGEIFTVHRLFGSPRAYKFAEITKIDFREKKVYIFTGTKRIKVSNEAVNFQALALRLKSEGMPMYQNGKLME